jgi:hypothetical protein
MRNRKSCSGMGSGRYLVGTLALAGLLGLLATPIVSLAHDDPATDGLIEGGGNPKTDCVAQFQTGLELNYPYPPKRRQKWLACIDGDASCDADGAVNGSCSIGVGICLADDEDTPECIPAGMSEGSVVIKHKPEDTDLADLQTQVDQLLASGVPCDNPGAPPGNCFQCTDNQVLVTASLSHKKGKKKIKLKAVTDPGGPKNKPIKDRDKLKIRCLDCESASAFEHLNKIMFRPNCGSSGVCHTGPSPAAGMNLDYTSIGLSGVYDELVNEAPTSPGAAALGMSRILPADPDLETVSSSLILEKLRHTQSELDAICTDGGQSVGCLGGPMPPGVDKFSTGKLDLLKTWIAAGASQTGWPAGATCGEPEDIWTPADPLPVPDPSEGFQIHFQAPEGFVVEPGTEFEGCQWIAVPPEITQTMYVSEIQMRLNPGTHHMIIYRDQPDSGPAASPTSFDPDDTLCNKQFGLKSFLAGTQDPEFTAQEPNQVSEEVAPGEVFGINMHYTNPYNVPIYPEIWINFYGSTTPTAKQAINIFPGDLGFSIPPHTAGEGNLVFYQHNNPTPGCYYSLTSHEHRRGTGVKIWTSQPSSWDDPTDMIYYSTDWDHPVQLSPSPRLLLNQGDRLWFQCQWDNGVYTDVTRRCQPASGPSCGTFNQFVCFTNADCGAGTTGVCEDCPLDFGFLSEDEMCFLPGFYYEADPGPDPCPY